MSSFLTTNGALDGLFGTVKDSMNKGLSEGVSSIFSDVLPQWAAKQVGIDQNNTQGETNPQIGTSNPVNTSSLGNMAKEDWAIYEKNVTENKAGFLEGIFKDMDQQTMLAGGLVIIGIVVALRVLT